MERMPANIIRVIADEVRTHPRAARDLLSLVLTSRQLHNAYYSELYYEIRLHPINMKFARLVMRLWENPILAEHIRILQLVRIRDPPTPQGLRMPDDVAAFFEEALHMIFTPEEEQTGLWKFYTYRKILHPTAWTILLLICAKNVRTIELEHEVNGAVSYVTKKAITREKPFEQAPTFQNLREIFQTSLRNDACVNSGYLDAVLYFPRIERIVADEIADVTDLMLREIPPQNVTSKLQKIFIDHCYWCHGLLRWLEACNKLEKVYIRMDVAPNWFFSEEDLVFHAPTFRACLLPSAETLNSLEVYFAPRLLLDSHAQLFSDPHGEEAANEPFGSFKEFRTLRSLVMRYAHLRGSLSLQPFSQVLPGSLKLLIVSAPMKDTEVELFRALIEMLRSGRFPMLGLLGVSREEPAAVGGDEAMEALQTECDAKGVPFFELFEF